MMVCFGDIKPAIRPFSWAALLTALWTVAAAAENNQPKGKPQDYASATAGRAWPPGGS